MVNQRLHALRDFLFPGQCLLCGARLACGAELCAPCEAELPWLQSACLCCAAPLPAAGLRCARCQQSPPAFERTVALFRYAAPVDQLILRLKYHGDLGLARLLGTRLAARLADARVDRIVPVPLHRTRLRSRGYNQALELARPIARRLGVPLDYRAVTRTRATAPHVDLDHEARRRNVRGAFRARTDLAGARVAIVDDVMTSGHTANAVAAALRAAGASAVAVWVVARA